MSSFDTIIIKCPKCTNTIKYQSKVGDCMMKTYSIHKAPPIIQGELDGASFDCEKCKYHFSIKVITHVVFY
jgi:transposase-like protein